jgi:hypothetical protein
MSSSKGFYFVTKIFVLIGLRLSDIFGECVYDCNILTSPYLYIIVHQKENKRKYEEQKN